MEKGKTVGTQEELSVTPALQELVSNIQKGKARRSRWEHVIDDRQTLRGLLFIAALERETSPSMLGDRNDLKKPFAILGGTSLHGLLHYVRQHHIAKGENAVAFLLEKAGIQATVDDLSWRMLDGKEIDWARIKGAPLAALTNELATTLKKPAIEITTRNFRTPLQVLNGRNLGSLENFLRNHRGDTPETIFLFQRAGLALSDEEI